MPSGNAGSSREYWSTELTFGFVGLHGPDGVHKET